MAQKVTVLSIDDIDGSEAAETVSFGLDGISYEIDLSAGNAGEMRAALELYISKARKAPRVSRRPARNRNAPGAPDSERIRQWARSQGIEVKDRGRVPADVVARYEAANS